MNCPRCQTSNRESARFCNQCGLWLGADCPNCGSKLVEQAIFCDQCGYQVSPLAAAGRQWVNHDVSPSPDAALYRRQQELTAKAAALSDHVSTQPGTGQQPDHSPLQKYIPRELMAKLETARASGTMAGERRIVTMLFCDLKGSTAAAEQLDPEDWTEIINGAFEYMIRPVYAYEGTVARLMGDGILAFFGAPIAHEDDPQRAVLAGLDITAGIAPYREQIRNQWGVDINVRVGINTGLVVVGTVGSDLRMEYTAMGDAINLAARMEQTAEPGTVQIAHDTYKNVKPLFDFETLGEIEIKGKDEKVSAYRVIGLKEVAGRRRGIEGLQTAMVGRDRELDTLNEIMARVHQGVGHIVSIIGDAGLGKSRLIREAKQYAAGAAQIEFLETASLSYETTHPYGLFQRQLRKLYDISPADTTQRVGETLEAVVADLGEEKKERVMRVLEALFNLQTDDARPPLEGEAFRRELFQVMPLLWRQRFGEHPTVLIFEDVHWSDPASIELLTQLLSLTDEIPLVLLCSYRPDRGGPVWALRTKADESFHHRYTEIILRPLPKEQVDELVSSLLHIAELPNALYERIQERAAGNPFFVEEVVRSLIDSGAVTSDERVENGQVQTVWRASGDGQQVEIPSSLQSLLAARIDRLQEETRRILQMAAVIGRSFYQRVLVTVGDQFNGHGLQVEREISQLLQNEMIREASRIPELEYRFSNPLTQEVAYQTILLKQRREFHHQVAEAIEDLFPEHLQEMAANLGYHYREAGDYAAAVKYFAMAGEDAFRLYANREAITHYDEALALVKQTTIDADLLATIYANRGRALELISDYAAAIDNYAAMGREAELRNDDKLRLGALIGRTLIHSTLTPVFDAEIGLPLAQKALELADKLDEHAAKAEVLWALMLVHAYVFGMFEQAITYGEQALELCRNWDLEARLPYVINDLGRSKGFVGRIPESLELLAEARPLFEAQNNLPMLVDNANAYAIILLFAGRFDEALAYAFNAVELSQAQESTFGTRDSLARVGHIHIEMGKLGEGIARCEDLIARYIEQDDVVVFTMPNLAVGYISLEIRSAILQRYEAEKHRSDQLGPFFRDYFQAALAWLYALENRPEQAAEVLGQSNYDVGRETFTPIRAPIFMAFAQLLFARDQYEELIAFIDQIVKVQAQLGLNYYLADFLLLQAKALLALEVPKLDEAREALQAGRSAQEEIGSTRILWRILIELAALVDEQKRPALYREAKRVIIQIAEDIVDETLRHVFLELPAVEEVMAIDD